MGKNQQVVILAAVTGFICLLGAGILLLNIANPSFQLMVEFDNIKGLKIGSPVLWNGYQVGEVRNQVLRPDQVIEVALSIDQAHVHLMRQGIIAAVSKDLMPGSISSVVIGLPENQINRPPLKSDDRIQGVSYLTFKMKMAMGKVNQSVNNCLSNWAQAMEDMEEYLDSPEMHQLYDDIQDFSQSLFESDSRSMDQMQDGEGAAVQQKMNDLADELEKRGHADKARELRKLAEQGVGSPDAKAVHASSG